EGGVGVPGASVDELAAELARADGALRNQSRATALYGASRPEQHAGVAATKRQGVRQGVVELARAWPLTDFDIESVGQASSPVARHTPPLDGRDTEGRLGDAAGTEQVTRGGFGGRHERVPAEDARNRAG